MPFSALGLGTIFLLSTAATLLLRGTTYYITESDRLLIRRLGSIWLEIMFCDVEEIECGSLFFDRLPQLTVYQIGIGVPFGLSASKRKSGPGKLVRITRKKGIRYVLINPSDPAPIIEAFRRFGASHWSEPPIQSRYPLPDFLRPR